jgi:hypothetical protein
MYLRQSHCYSFAPTLLPPSWYPCAVISANASVCSGPPSAKHSQQHARTYVNSLPFDLKMMLIIIGWLRTHQGLGRPGLSSTFPYHAGRSTYGRRCAYARLHKRDKCSVYRDKLRTAAIAGAFNEHSPRRIWRLSARLDASLLEQNEKIIYPLSIIRYCTIMH